MTGPRASPPRSRRRRESTEPPLWFRELITAIVLSVWVGLSVADVISTSFDVPMAVHALVLGVVTWALTGSMTKRGS